MSTLNVANISDDQSTLTGANENPTDRLHFNKTVDTKFVTNGCAKVWAAYAHTTGLNESFNLSTFTDNENGDYSLSLTSSFSNVNYAVGSTSRSGGGRTNVLDSASTASVVRTNLYVTSSGATTDGDGTLIAHGDLA